MEKNTPISTEINKNTEGVPSNINNSIIYNGEGLA